MGDKVLISNDGKVLIDTSGDTHKVLIGGGCEPCPDPDALTITVTFSGITICDGGSPCDLNGAFILLNIGSGEWFLDFCFDVGSMTFLRFWHVFCSGAGDTSLIIFGGGEGGAGFSGVGCAPTLQNLILSCDEGEGAFGGTATVSTP